MSEDEKKIAVINRIFKKANKKYVCPGCHTSFTRFDSLTDHCKRKIHEKHEGLKEFLGWQDADKKLVLPPDRADELKIGSFSQRRTRSRIQWLLKIAMASGMTYVCPCCLDKDFEYFNTTTKFRNHCWKKGDATHIGLISTNSWNFFPYYLEAMNRGKDEVLPDPLAGCSRSGPPSYHDYLKLDYVFQERM